jgi:uncharacterized protein (UPF0333 family)
MENISIETLLLILCIVIIILSVIVFVLIKKGGRRELDMNNLRTKISSLADEKFQEFKSKEINN